jgi:hypothetical protein
MRNRRQVKMKGEKHMNKGLAGFLRWIPAAMTVAALLVVFPAVPAWCATALELCGAAVAQDSTKDTDGDGISDYDECQGFMTLGSASIPLTGYMQSPQGASRPTYLDPSTKDIFYIVVTTTPSLVLRAFGNNLDAALDIYAQGIGVTVHRLDGTNATPDRIVRAYDLSSASPRFQRAVKITESLDNAVASPLGETWQGTPNGQDATKIYTRRIEGSVYKNCPSTVSESNCKDISGVAGKENVVNLYIREVISHEVGHATSLAPNYSSKYEWHYAPQSAVIMEPSMKVVSTTSCRNCAPTAATFYIRTGFNPADPPAAKIAGGY